MIDPECARTEEVLRSYQRRYLGVTEATWTVRPSPLGGRGLFATAPLRPGDLIFHDKPVVAGPRSKIDVPMCASCHRHGRVSNCPGGCYLPVCSPECSKSTSHIRECRLVRESMTMAEGSWRLDLLGSLTPLRCLFLDSQDREVVQVLQINRGTIHGVEVDLLKHHMRDNLTKEDEEWMRLCCCAMDANAFEFLKIHHDGAKTSLRGLYPLAAIMNNDCSPNSCHVYDSEGTMRLFTARDIAAGEEVTTSYSVLLWSTNIRRMNLSRTKHFLCHCARCADPTEFGSLLSCLGCVEGGCRGLLLPVNPLMTNSRWLCDSCGLQVSPKQAVQLLTTQGTVLHTLGSTDPLTLAQFLTDSVHTLPPQSQVVQQIKHKLLWQLGHTPGFTYHELSEDMLTLKEQCCRDTLGLLETLRFGLSRMRGLVLLELHATLCERIRRVGVTLTNKQATLEELSSLLSTARLILQEDAAARQDQLLRTEEQLQITATLT